MEDLSQRLQQREAGLRQQLEQREKALRDQRAL